MNRIVVGGISGAGKSTLARAIAETLDVTYVESDALLHGPDWTRRPTFEEDLSEALPRDGRWVTDGGGPLGRDIVWPRADTLVWLDLSRAVVMWRVVTRSVRRAARRERLWAGNRERLADWLRPDHPIRFAWSTHGPRRKEYEELLDRAVYPHLEPHLEVIRLRTPVATEVWLERLRDR